MKTNEMIAENNRLRELLTIENKVYYENLLLYVRLEGMMRDERKIESFLLEVLQDMLAAQKDGVSAKAYFGKTPKAIADDYLSVLPRSIWEGVKLVMIVLVSYLGSSLFPTLTTTGKLIDVGSLMIAGVYLFVVVMILFKYMATTIYQLSVRRINKWFRYMIFAGIGIGVFLPLYSISQWIKTPLQINLDGILGIVVIVVAWLIGLYFYLKISDKKMWTPFVFAAFMLGMMGIAARLPSLSGLINLKSGRYIYAGLMMLVMVIFYLMSYFASKKIKKEENN